MNESLTVHIQTEFADFVRIILRKEDENYPIQWNLVINSLIIRLSHL